MDMLKKESQMCKEWRMFHESAVIMILFISLYIENCFFAKQYQPNPFNLYLLIIPSICIFSILQYFIIVYLSLPQYTFP